MSWVVDKEVPFGTIVEPDDSEGPPLMVAQDGKRDCGCQIMVGHILTGDVLTRALMANGDKDAISTLHEDSAALFFFPCVAHQEDETAQRFMASYTSSLDDPDNPDDRHAIDTAIEFLEMELGPKQ